MQQHLPALTAVQGLAFLPRDAGEVILVDSEVAGSLPLKEVPADSTLVEIKLANGKRASKVLELHWPGLKSVSLQLCKLEDLAHIFKEFVTNSLSSLQISGCPYLSLAEMINKSQLPTLKKLEISSCTLSVSIMQIMNANLPML